MIFSAFKVNSSANLEGLATLQPKAQDVDNNIFTSLGSSKFHSRKSNTKPNLSFSYHYRPTTKIYSQSQLREVHQEKYPRRFSPSYLSSTRKTLIFAAITFTVLVGLQTASATTAGELAALASASAVDPEITLNCHRRHYTKIVTVEDENGKVCWDHVNIMSCWGRCDSNEIADWKFPYKRSHHPVCLHASTRQNSVVLQNCDPDVLPGTELHVFQEADVCACSLCKSSEASCEGLRYRGARRAPRDTAKVLEETEEEGVGIKGGKRFRRYVKSEAEEVEMSKKFKTVSASSAIRVKKNVAPDESFYASEAMQPALFFSNDVKLQPQKELKAREMLGGYDPLTGRNEGALEPFVQRSVKGFNFLAQNRPIGARGIGVISSVVESDPAYGSDVKNNSNVFSVNANRLTSPYEASSPSDKFSTLFKKYPKLMGGGNLGDIHFNYLSGKYPLNELGSNAPDNMMKPMLDLKKKRHPEGY